MQNFGIEVAEGSDITNLTIPSGTETRPRNVAIMYVIKY